MDHPYGHSKISFFSAGFEGGMIVLAALYIIYTSIHKWMTGLELENIGAGSILTSSTVLINGALGAYLIWLGKKKGSIILEANGHHVLTDCWTSIGVLAALGLIFFTGWLPWDPIFGILMGPIFFMRDINSSVKASQDSWMKLIPQPQKWRRDTG